MIDVTHADRVVFPDVNRTKGDVVAYYDRIAARALVHLAARPLSIRRYPKGILDAGFFQKNIPAHYPESIGRFAIPRSAAAAKKQPRKSAENQEVTVYPVLSAPEQIAYIANQGAIELHVPTARITDLHRPDRVVIDLDPPPGALALVRRAAIMTCDLLAELGLPTVPMATGSKGYHVVAAIAPVVEVETLGVAIHKTATLLAARHSDEMTLAFRVAARGQRVFIDWLRNFPVATVVAPYSLRARPRATIATPLAWSELETIPPDGFSLADVDRLLDRPDSLADLAASPTDPRPFVSAVDAMFERSGLVLEPFDRFRS